MSVGKSPKAQIATGAINYSAAAKPEMICEEVACVNEKTSDRTKRSYLYSFPPCGRLGGGGEKQKKKMTLSAGRLPDSKTLRGRYNETSQ